MLESDDEEAEVKVPEASMSWAISEGLASLDTALCSLCASVRHNARE